VGTSEGWGLYPGQSPAKSCVRPAVAGGLGLLWRRNRAIEVKHPGNPQNEKALEPSGKRSCQGEGEQS
jgi:hypothetical protein